MTKKRNDITYPLKYEIVPLSDLPIHGKAPNPYALRLTSELQKIENDKAIKVQTPDRATAHRLGGAVRRKSKTLGFLVTTRIKPTDDGCLLYLMKLD